MWSLSLTNTIKQQMMWDRLFRSMLSVISRAWWENAPNYYQCRFVVWQGKQIKLNDSIYKLPHTQRECARNCQATIEMKIVLVFKTWEASSWLGNDNKCRKTNRCKLTEQECWKKLIMTCMHTTHKTWKQWRENPTTQKVQTHSQYANIHWKQWRDSLKYCNWLFRAWTVLFQFHWIQELRNRTYETQVHYFWNGICWQVMDLAN